MQLCARVQFLLEYYNQDFFKPPCLFIFEIINKQKSSCPSSFLLGSNILSIYANLEITLYSFTNNALFLQIDGNCQQTDIKTGSYYAYTMSEYRNGKKSPRPDLQGYRMRKERRYGRLFLVNVAGTRYGNGIIKLELKEKSREVRVRYVAK